ncbi:hypothetical protein JANAI62_32130 [Jannaschia pagri]|uniref:Lipoprotein n=1 Tax=Jannaschia pagri TaxID=2829797 RepID=A0ABQ4NQ94_9RHOB|nr:MULTISPECIES: hypothetical protein [unclassified Jannaschia]GIT92550.1 hypothetical protein JANAI61_30080 [Jannaschia sp. AI_61]GIT96590.1 hypothetical protein JANAI62_32130 [Jannaschia sp. AI_62]
MRWVLACGLCVCVAACNGADPIPSQAPDPRFVGLTLVPVSTGLAVARSGGRHIDFGRARDGALSTIAAIAGKAPVAQPCEGLDAFAVGTDLIVIFSADRFVGWQTRTGRAGRACGAGAV